jgi:hypothetical protein
MKIQIDDVDTVVQQFQNGNLFYLDRSYDLEKLKSLCCSNEIGFTEVKDNTITCYKTEMAHIEIGK